jgi:iron complex outermembrane receptor protein
MNGDIFDDMLLGTEGVLDVDLIERVEIVRGPGSSLYGTNAFFGVINVVTRSGESLAGYQVAAGGSSYVTGQGSVRWGSRLAEDADLLLSGTRYGSDGQDHYYAEFDDPSTNNGVATDVDGDEFYRLFARARFGHFRIEALHASRDKSIPTASFGTAFNDPRTRTVDSRTYLDLGYERTVREGIDLSGRLYYDRAYYHGDYPFDYPPLTLNKDSTRGDWWGTEARLVARPSKRHTLTAGAEYRDHFRQDLLNYDSDPYFVYVDEQHSSRDWAVFVQEEYAPRAGLIVNLGLRHDQYGSFGGTTNPRLAIIYAPVPDSALKFIYGTAFRAPNPYELFYQGSALGYKSVPGLRPETIQTAEFVFERYWRRNLRVAASVFQNDVEDLVTIQTDPNDGLLFFTNQEQARSRGVEIEFERRWPKGYEAKWSHTYQESTDRLTGESLVNSPRTLSKLNVLVPLPGRRVMAGLELQYVGSRRTLADQQAPAYWLTNVNFLSRALAKGLDLSVGVCNLLDEDYGEPGSEEHLQDVILQNGRSFRVQVTWTPGR